MRNINARANPPNRKAELQCFGRGKFLYLIALYWLGKFCWCSVFFTTKYDVL